ncbi:E3 ubiquitin-protein ligase parkin [Pelomyxa schiedti]|nr:E3 ubiquitin-protein ligase parkin [Pelomyxa schiedti]
MSATPAESAAPAEDKKVVPPPSTAAADARGAAATATTAAAAPPSEHINLKVVAQDGTEVFFKIKKNTQLKKLMDAYCQRQAISPHAIRFLYDGERLQPDRTPAQLGLEDNDIIDAMLTQTGGASM